MSAPFGVPQILPGSGPDMADAYNYNAPVVAHHLQQAWQQVQDPRFWADAANKWAQGILMGTTAPEVGGLAGGAAGIRAFHGSPHDFDRFSSQNIGSGEGAQAYGHGLYFAGNENVAKNYRDTLSQPTNDELLAYFDKHGTFPPERGHMYEVNIAANPDQLLDWDKPLSEQPMQVQAALQSLNVPAKLDSPGFPYVSEEIPRGNATGQALYRWLEAKSRYGHPSYSEGVLPPADWTPPLGGASEALRQAGIPGIKYLDAGSRGEGQGTHNYVVFNDNLINILRKYGVPGMIGAGAASAPFGFGVGAQQ